MDNQQQKWKCADCGKMRPQTGSCSHCKRSTAKVEYLKEVKYTNEEYDFFCSIGYEPKQAIALIARSLKITPRTVERRIESTNAA
ncbi:hypothetical protein CBE89_00095 [Corynebacterium striatum]|uniref:Uncharacterized protein n=1 Tax=Corynebacterium striatum TaxID=43770 RepID=A0A2Z2IW58_CORST|nr:hypothetical protein CBE89_00095 [Corynebacterium striatum]